MLASIAGFCGRATGHSWGPTCARVYRRSTDMQSAELHVFFFSHHPLPTAQPYRIYTLLLAGLPNTHAHLKTTTPPTEHHLANVWFHLYLVGCQRSPIMAHVVLSRQHINTTCELSYLSTSLFIFIPSLSPILFMDTRRKNKSAHPGVPDMTRSQLSSAGLPHPPAPHHKKATKDQQIATLQDELGSIRELLSNVSCLTPSKSLHRITHKFVFQTQSNSHAECTNQAQDVEVDTDPRTDLELQTAVVGTKRKRSGGTTSRYAQKSSFCFLRFNFTHRLKRSKAMDPFESSSMVHAGATGLVDNWRTMISPYGTASPQSLTLNLRQAADHDASPALSPTSSTTMISHVSTPSPFSVRAH